MKIFTLNPKKHYLVNKGEWFFAEGDLQESIKSCTPGEWIKVKVAENVLLGFVNPHAIDSYPITILGGYDENPKDYIFDKIKSAISKREVFNYSGARIFYGFADGLPGLIVDSYENVVIVQINTAGIDRYREDIVKYLKAHFLEKTVSILDNESYRKKEGLPIFDSKNLPDLIYVKESEFSYELSKEVMQKVGYYYDHRENRLKLENTLKRFNKKFTKGLDLFCYIGSWGLHILRSNVEATDFVDQANMKEIVLKNVKQNGFDESKCNFYRKDVFSFLDEAIANKMKYDVIICDPPSFTKSAKNKNSAISGYEKLYQKIFKIAEPGSIVVAASCTQYINIEELDATVNKAARDQKRKIQLLDIGIAGWDHPCESLSSKSNYIKYLCFYTE